MPNRCIFTRSLLSSASSRFSSAICRDNAYGVQFQYNDVDFLIKPEVAYIYAPNIEVYEDGSSVNSHLLMVNGVYDVEYTELLTPFLKAGAGYQHTGDAPGVNTDSLLIGAGAGLKFALRDHLSIKFETTFTLHDMDDKNLLVFGGLDFAFGLEENIPPSQIAVEHTYGLPVLITKESPKEHVKEEIVIRDGNGEIRKLILFIPYLFRDYALDDRSELLLKQYAGEIAKDDVTLHVIGHTDSKGRRAFNKELSLKRADVIKWQLVGYGFDPKRITVEGHGEEHPFADNETEAGRRANNRIEILVEERR